MKKTTPRRFGLTCITFVLVLAAATRPNAQTPPELFAQRLVDETLAKHPEVAHLVMHVTPPNKPDTENVIIASSIGRIGKRADEDDLRIMHTGNVEAVLAKSGDRFNVSLPLLDAAGNTIGVLAVGFPYKPGDDKAILLRAAEQLRDDLKAQIPDVQRLFSGLTLPPHRVPAAANWRPPPSMADTCRRA
jgi:hypothetical protein